MEEDDAGLADEEDAADAPAAPPPGGLFGRLFPPAPPLPNKPDPLTGFTYQGPLRGLVAGFYLLGQHPVPWIGMGTVWAVGRLVTTSTLVGLVASLVSFGALIAAGWIGWQRPWLFGLMGSIFGILLFALIRSALIAGFTSADPFAEFVAAILVETAGFQPLFGVVAGWYGGYLRRRMATVPRKGSSGRGQRARRR